MIETTDDPFEKHVLQWCIENWIPLRQFHRGEIHLAFYEHLSVEPREEIHRLFSFLGRPFTERIFDRIERPSRMTWGRHGGKPQKSDPEAWKPFVSADRVKRSLAILSQFGLDAIYGQAALPDTAAAQAMLAPVSDMGLKTHVQPAQ